MHKWDEDTTLEAKRFFPTLSTNEIRRRQDLCSQQIVIAQKACNIDALEDLREMEKCLQEEMLRRLTDQD